MKKTYLLLLLLLWIMTSATDCYKEAYDQKRTRIYVKGEFSNTKDTMYVGDTLTLTITIPDSSFRVNEITNDTSWYRISSFKMHESGYAMYRIDTSQENKIDLINNYAETIFEIGSNAIPYSENYPFRRQIKTVFKMPGIYFFQTSSDLVPYISGISGSMILDWDVPTKNFELLKDLEGTCVNCSVEDFISLDINDIYNFFPFVVLPK